MGMRHGLLAWAGVAAIAVGTGCKEDPPAPPPPCSFGTACTPDSGNDSGVDPDGGNDAGVNDDGGMNPDGGNDGGCQADGGCMMEPGELGDRCTENADCTSDNCGAAAENPPHCMVPAGDSCDGDNCGECVTTPDDGTVCLQACLEPTDCEPTEVCAALGGSGFYCRPSCDTSECADGYECTFVSDGHFGYNVCGPLERVEGRAGHICHPAAGDYGYPDMCGECDEDRDNDCTQDCAGEWGGNAYTDGCGTCDADPTNDCAH